MPASRPAIPSRLPDVGTTIFTVMSRLAAEHDAINLSQGFPDYSAPPLLYDLVSKHMRAGSNQYAPMAGVPALREAIAAKVEALYGARYDPEHEITVTAGGTQAIYTAITCLVRPGDEVIVFEPAYDSYAPSVVLNGGKVVRARLAYPDYRPDWAAVRRLVTPRTRAVIVNTPHNPSGTTWTQADLRALARLVDGTDIAVIADEVYEHIVFDGLRHESCARYPELAARSFVVSSFGKTYHVTGWKIGYVLAPRELTTEFRRAHQFVVFTVNTPVQLALAEYLRDASRYLELGAFYQRKRDLFRAALSASRLRPLSCTGTYFQLASYAGLTDEPDAALAERLTRELGVASIPVSPFYEEPPGEPVLRFCFAKNDDTLLRACERLARV
ncbi:pyridoxal phosphate-dependent aminotransferase [Anaeromyxobacter oryzisoli]|uniref:pyridoxal phosphate-dependent aminotransferase n=1 Tax=Anaeromyxobacter oryzisoli TaxID=2925408 RepID=UPI001F59BD24|nr:pyridoxal phosphate-dependent aminotransferase [Anaeromyxobacter sp. SG63]